MELSIIYIIIRTLPESIVILLSGVLLLDVKINAKELIYKGLILGFIVGGIRIVLPISFGVHTILSMIVLGVMLYKISDKDLIKAITTTCMILMSLALSESIYVIIATNILNIKLDTLMNNQSLEGALITLPSLIIVFIIVKILKLIQFKMKPLASKTK